MANTRKRVDRGIYLRTPSKTFEVVVTDSVTGRQRSATARTLSDARLLRATMLSAATTVTTVAVVDEGASVCGSTVTEAVGEYLLLKDLSSRTVILYEGLYSRHARPAIGETALADLKAKDVDSVYAVMRSKGLSVTTIRQLHKILSAVLEQHVRWGLLSENVMGRATPPRPLGNSIVPPTFAEVSLLNHAADKHDPEFGRLVRVVSCTGLRRGEVIGLRWSDIAADAFVVRRQIVMEQGVPSENQTKTGNVRRLPLPKIVADSFEEQRQSQIARAAEIGAVLPIDGYVFGRDPLGVSPHRPDGISSRWNYVRRSVGLETRFHDLRHAAASWLLADGVDIRTVSAWLGHSSASVTLNVYAHVVPGRLEAAASVLDALGGRFDGLNP